MFSDEVEVRNEFRGEFDGYRANEEEVVRCDERVKISASCAMRRQTISSRKGRRIH